MSEPEKFCVDCRNRSADRCLNAPLPGSNEALGHWLVDGKGPRPSREEGFYFCWVERASLSESACGPVGRFWEAKT